MLSKRDRLECCVCKRLDQGEQSEMVGEAASWSRTEE